MYSTIKFPLFSGEENQNVNKFITNFEEIFQIIGLKEDIKLLQLKQSLNGKAKAKVESREFKEYNELKKYLLDRFTVDTENDMEILKEIIVIEQNAYENIRDYADRITRLTNKMKSKVLIPTEEQLIKYFINGCKKDIKRCLLRENEIKTMAEATDLARKEELIMLKCEPKSNVEIEQIAMLGLVNEAIEKKFEIMNNNVKNSVEEILRKIENSNIDQLNNVNNQNTRKTTTIAGVRDPQRDYRVDYDKNNNKLKRNDNPSKPRYNHNNVHSITCQICDRKGHGAKECWYRRKN